MQMLAPIHAASSSATRYSASTVPPRIAANDTHSPTPQEGSYALIQASPPPQRTSEQASDMDAAREARANASGRSGPAALGSRPASEPSTDTQDELREPAIDAAAEATDPADRRWHWLSPGVASVALLGTGLIALWLAPSLERRPAPPGQAADHAQTSTVKPASATTVTLTLAGLPDDASVALDGAPANAMMRLPRSGRAHGVAVLAPGKQPWHVSFVPNADQTLQVVLLDAPPTAAPTPSPPTRSSPTNASKRGVIKARSQGQQSVLREPDF
jgi:hypothetical protein